MKIFNEGRAALITGAAQGIGFAIAEKFIKEGISKIAVADINEEKIAEAAEQLQKFGNAEVLPVVCNAGDKEQAEAAVQKVLDKFGYIDILVNNAGINRDAMFHKMSFEQWDLVIKINLYGAYYFSSAVMQQMRDRGYGRILNMSSTSAYGNAGQANYAATKSALISFTKSLAREGARKNIVVNAIAPDFIDTAMVRGIPQADWDRVLAASPMLRPGRVDEVASIAAFLCSEECSYVSGTCIDVSGARRT